MVDDHLCLDVIALTLSWNVDPGLGLLLQPLLGDPLLADEQREEGVGHVEGGLETAVALGGDVRAPGVVQLLGCRKVVVDGAAVLVQRVATGVL